MPRTRRARPDPAGLCTQAGGGSISMGAGRKTFSYDCDTRNETNYRFEQQQKNLGTQLGGVIFSERRRRRRRCCRWLEAPPACPPASLQSKECNAWLVSPRLRVIPLVLPDLSLLPAPGPTSPLRRLLPRSVQQQDVPNLHGQHDVWPALPPLVLRAICSGRVRQACAVLY